LTFGLGIIILQGVSRRKSLAGVNIDKMACHIDGLVTGTGQKQPFTLVGTYLAGKRWLEISRLTKTIKN
jgi:hypothetical protein